jgi:hypothetical protein
MTTAADGGPALEVAPEPWSLLSEVTVTPLARGDVGAIQQVFDGLSPGSRYLRFLTPTPALAPALADRLAEVDHDRHGCWVAPHRWRAGGDRPVHPYRHRPGGRRDRPRGGGCLSRARPGAGCCSR